MADIKLSLMRFVRKKKCPSFVMIECGIRLIQDKLRFNFDFNFISYLMVKDILFSRGCNPICQLEEE